MARQARQFASQARLYRVLYWRIHARWRSQSDTMRLQLSILALPQLGRIKSCLPQPWFAVLRH